MKWFIIGMKWATFLLVCANTACCVGLIKSEMIGRPIFHAILTVCMVISHLYWGREQKKVLTHVQLKDKI